MRIERTKNTINGFFWGATGKIINTILPFAVRSIMIYKLGVEYLGLSSLFASIIQVLSLSELGFSYACVYAMYKPIANDDCKAVGAILHYLKKIYAIIGTIVTVGGLLLLPFIKNFISGEVPAGMNIYVLYLIYLGNSSLSYFFFAYKTSLLNALQCNDIISKVGIITNTMLRVFQCIVLLLYPNYYIYVILIPLSTLANNIIKSMIVDRRFKQYTVPGEIDDEVRKDIKNRIIPLIGIKIATVLLNAADTIVISAFLGLKDTALYNNYYFIMTSVQSIIFEVYSSMIGGVGNSLVIDSQLQINQRFRMLNFINSWLTVVCTACFVCLYQPFMMLWVGKDNMLPFGMVIMFSTYYYATAIERIVVVYKDAAGVWKEDMLRCYLGCAINIVLNVLLVQVIGLYGVIGSSVLVSLLIDPWMARTVYRKVLHSSSKEYYLRLCKNMAVCVMCCAVSVFVCRSFQQQWIGLVICGIVCLLLSNILFVAFYFRDSEFLKSVKWLYKIISKLFIRRMTN